MAVISFSDEPGSTWVTGGWAFRQVLADVISHYPDDSEMVSVLTEESECNYLLIAFLDPKLATRIVRAITHVVEGILSGTVRSGILDQTWSNRETVELYRKLLQELSAAIPREPKTDSP